MFGCQWEAVGGKREKAGLWRKTVGLKILLKALGLVDLLSLLYNSQIKLDELSDLFLYRYYFK